jgi:hypothetical protein
MLIAKCCFADFVPVLMELHVFCLSGASLMPVTRDWLRK